MKYTIAMLMLLTLISCASTSKTSLERSNCLKIYKNSEASVQCY